MSPNIGVDLIKRLVLNNSNYNTHDKNILKKFSLSEDIFPQIIYTNQSIFYLFKCHVFNLILQHVHTCIYKRT